MANLPHSVEELFEAALDLPADERPAFLDQVCRNQPMLRRMTEELLAEDAQAGSFLAEPIFGITAPYESVVVSPADAGRTRPLGRPASKQRMSSLIALSSSASSLAEAWVKVYEVEDLWLHGTHVALKVIRPEIAADAAHSRRFEQEVLLARKVTHPNLCPIYEIFRCDDAAPPFLFLTMKLLAGETLAARLRASRALSRADRELVCRELVHAVAALHAGGIIHRDITPGNVMLDTTVAPFRVALMDFGLARLREAEPTVFDRHSEFSSGAVVVAGTPGYLAPELLRGDPPDEASDLFALGVVLHQLFTGSRPKSSRDGHSVQPSSSLRLCHVSGEMIRGVEGLLSANPDRRLRAFEHLHGMLSSQRATVLPRPQITRRTLAISRVPPSAALLQARSGNTHDP